MEKLQPVSARDKRQAKQIAVRKIPVKYKVERGGISARTWSDIGTEASRGIEVSVLSHAQLSEAPLPVPCSEQGLHCPHLHKAFPTQTVLHPTSHSVLGNN